MDALTAPGRRPGRELRASLGIGLAGLLLAACVWLLPRSARAAAADDQRCIAAEALGGLDATEQARVVRACKQGSRPGPGLVPLLARLAARSSWESAALGDLFVGAAPHLDLGADDPAAAQRLRAVRDALHGPRTGPCTRLYRALDLYFKARDAGDRVTPPFAADTLADCVPLAPGALTDIALLAIPAESTSALFVAASASERVVLQWFTDADAVVHDQRRVFVVAVPRWSVVTVRAVTDPTRAAAESTPPRLWHAFVVRDQTVGDQPSSVGCLRMSVDIDADTTLLLDGQPLTSGKSLTHRTVAVSSGAHELVAVRCAGDACAVRFREVLPASAASATRNLCQDVSLDLHQRRSVAVLQVRASPGCDAALAWQAGELAAAHLKRSEAATGHVFRDLASYASITTAIGSLRAGLNPGAGQAVGADTGVDSLDLVASIAKEAWRQGIDELVNIELRCTGDAGLVVQATAISVREVFDRPLGPIAGLDLKNMLRVQSRPFVGEVQLATAVAGVLDQLFAVSYLRFHDGPRRFPYRTPARLELIASGRADVDGVPELVARHYHPSFVQARCRALHDDRAAAIRDIATLVARDPQKLTPIRFDRDDIAVQFGLGDDAVLWVAGDRPAVGTRSKTRMSTSVSAYLPPSRHGTYIVTAHWQHDGKLGPIVDATCVHFDVPGRETWATVMFAPDILIRTPNADYAARHLRVMAGFTRYPIAPWLGLGLAAGYTYSRTSASAGLPSWQDLAADPAESHASLGWSRHALVLGPLLEFRSRRANAPVELRRRRATIPLPVEFRARLSAGAGLAIVDVREVVQFTGFAGSSRFGNSALRLRPTVDATAEFGVSYSAGPLTIGHFITLGAVALNDMNSSAQAVSATGGAGLFAGLGLLLGGSRR